MPLLNDSILRNLVVNLSRYETYINWCTTVELSIVLRIELNAGIYINKHELIIVQNIIN